MSKDEDGASPSSLARAFTIIRFLAGSGPRGAALTENARQLGLPHPTVHRLLRKLIDEKVVRQQNADRRRPHDRKPRADVALPLASLRLEHREDLALHARPRIQPLLNVMSIP